MPTLDSEPNSWGLRWESMMLKPWVFHGKSMENPSPKKKNLQGSEKQIQSAMVILKTSLTCCSYQSKYFQALETAYAHLRYPQIFHTVRSPRRGCSHGHPTSVLVVDHSWRMFSRILARSKGMSGENPTCLVVYGWSTSTFLRRKRWQHKLTQKNILKTSPHELRREKQKSNSSPCEPTLPACHLLAKPGQEMRIILAWPQSFQGLFYQLFFGWVPAKHGR